MRKVLFLLVVILFNLNLTALWGRSYSVYEAVNLIEKEYNQNKLRLDQRCLYLIYALRDQEQLPTRFKVVKEEELRCGTPLILEVKSNWNSLSLETRDKINQLLARPVKELSYHTTHFVIHYDTAKSSTYPVYQPHVDVDPADGIPDYVNRVAEYMERSWYAIIDSMGYYAPPFDGTAGGDSLYDVYIDMPVGDAIAEELSSQYPDRPYAYTSYSTIGNDLRITRYPFDPLPFCKATCSHEFFHACQFVFNGDFLRPEDYTIWLYESGATWAEEPVFDDLNDVYYYLNDYLPVSQKSLYHEPGRHMYASWIWNQYLTENFGGDIIHSIWVKFIETFACAAVDSVLHTFGTSMNDQFQEFAVWNWFTSYRDDGAHYSEGSNFFIQDTVKYVATHSTYPVSNSISYLGPESYGANYVYFNTSSADSGSYWLSFAGDSQYVYGVNLILHKPSGSSYLKMTMDEICGGGLLIPDFNSYDGVIMVITHLFNLPERFGPAGYSYRLGRYIIGDVDDNAELEVSDAIYMVTYLFKGGPAPEPIQKGDCNCDYDFTISDVVYLINYLFKGGPKPGC